MEVEKVSLYFKDSRSDKEYHLQLQPEGEGWVVLYQNGPRGGTLASGRKTETAVPYEVAKKAYDKKLKEQLKKGYTPGAAGTAFVGTSLEERISGVTLQLLNPVRPDEAERLMKDPAWVMQNKHDGHRRAVKCSAFDVVGVNRKGLVTGLPQSVLDALGKLGDDRTTGLVIDGELMGDVLAVFDVLEHRGMDLRELPYRERLKRMAMLAEALDKPGASGIFVTETARTEAEKRALYEKAKRLKLEGVVFKRLDASFESGRPAAGGDQLKDKFKHMASVRVKKPHATKRSFSMELCDEHGVWQGVGNCTVPANQAIPSVNAIVEVEYLYAFRGGSLFQPQMKFIRDDIEVSSCTLAQLVFKAESTEDDES